MIAVYLKGLDTSYGGNDRYADYYIAPKSSEVYRYIGGHSLPAGIASTINGGVCYAEGLKPSTPYIIKVVISGISGGAISEKTLTKVLWTDDAQAEITELTCIRESTQEEGCFHVTCLFSVDNILEGTTTFEIWARESGTSKWYQKSGDDIYYSSIYYGIVGTIATGNIGIRLYDEYAFAKTYDIKLVVITNGQTSEQTAEITVRKSLITSFYGYQDPPGTNYTVCFFDFNFDGSGFQPENARISVSYYNAETGEPVADTDGGVFFSLEDVCVANLAVNEAAAALDYGKYTAHLELRVYDTGDDGLIYPIHHDLCECGLDVSASAPIINRFSIRQSEGGGKKVICDVSLSNVSIGLTKYEIYARQRGNSEWWSKSEVGATLTATSFSAEAILDNTGTYEFRLAVATDDQEAFAEATFTLAEMELFAWSKIYKSPSGGINLELSPAVYVPIVGKELRPVTAEDWNNLTARINLKRAEIEGLSQCSFTTVKTGQTFEPDIYNQAVKAIRSMGSGAGSYLNEIDETTVLSASLFTLLASELNEAIENL